MHILLGALIGGALFTVSYMVAQKIAGKPMSWHGAMGAFAGGVVTGAMAATTLGASLVAEGGVTAVTTIAVEGGAGSGTEQLVDNLLDKKPVMDGVVKQAVVGAATAPLFYGVFKGAAKFLPDAEKLAENPIAANVGAVVTDGKALVQDMMTDTEKALGKNAAADAAKAAQAIEAGSADASKAVAADASAPVIAADAPVVAADAPVVADAAAAPKVDPVTSSPTKPSIAARAGAKAKAVLSAPALKDTSHHVRAGTGLAASGIVLTGVNKIKDMFTSSSTNGTTATAATPAAPSAPAAATPGNSNVQISVPTTGTQPVSVTVTVGNPARGPVAGPVTNLSRLGSEDGAKAREGITGAIGKLGGNP